MTRRFSLRRTGTLLLAGALLIALAGDRGITATAQGIDPLEVLNLQVKPNVIVALDTSGSMEDTPYVGSAYGGDHQRSKMWQAKQVLKSVFQANQDKAAFLFGTYRFQTAANPVGNMTLRVNATPNRFVYTTQSWAAVTGAPNPACTVDPTSCPTPNPATVTLPVQGPSPSMATTNISLNSLYAFQWIRNSGGVANDTLRFSEATPAKTCTVTVANDFYTSGALLATAIQTAMRSCAGTANLYTVVYGAGTRTVNVASITRATTVATVTTSAPHGFANGATVTIAGATPAGYNGAKTITVTDATHFTYTVVNTLTTPATGTITAAIALGAANTFTFQGTGTSSFTLQWSQATSTIRAVLAAGTTDRTVAANGSWATGDPRINLLARTAANRLTETYDPDGASTTLVPSLDKPSPSRVVTTYNLDAQRFWNGETVFVDSTGAACDVVPGTPTAYPSVTLQRTTNCASGAASADASNKATFSWGGGMVTTGAGACQGFSSKVPLIPCDQLTPPQYTGLAPYLDNQLLLSATGALTGYSETSDGTGTVASNPTVGGALASGATPLAQTTNDVRTLFASLWGSGVQNITPIASATAPALPGGGISTHLSPKEKTIFILVTDGDQNCAPFTLGMTVGAPYVTTGVGAVTNGADAAALGAAAAAQRLYVPLSGTVNADGTINGDPASSVTTYVVAFGAGASKSRADWIAWGGSGMVRPLSPLSGNDTWTTIPTQAMRDACKTCVDSFLAPDPDTLKAVLEKVINQGATSGEFTAQQSLTDSIFELAGDVPQGAAPNPWSPMNPRNRYDPLVPHRFASTFTLPLFVGQIKAYTQGGPASLASPRASCSYTLTAGRITGEACLRWSANDKLVTRVTTGMTAACPVVTAAGVAAGECNFAKLWNGATDSNVGSLSGVGIRRRIYTTSQNGVFGPTVDNLIGGVSPYRVALWPPQTASIAVPVAPASNTQQGLFDAQLGLPLDTAANPAAAFADLRTRFKACMGTNLPATCPAVTVTSGFTLAQMQRARREAREMILAFLAGAQFKADALGDPKRATAISGAYAVGDVLYERRTQILAESTLATPAVISPPQAELPEATVWKTEYELYRDGPRTHTDPTKEPDGVNPGGPSLIRAGFALRNPDADGNNTVAGTVQGRVFYNDDTRLGLKPVMSVMYAGTNTALHAFRAGPSVKTVISTACTPSATVDCGGEELWAFVPYDQLGKLPNRYLNNPQKRDPHDYMMARGIRFSDVFVPNPGAAADPSTTPVAKTAGGVSLGEIQGVWRKVLFVGRGKGGKFMTAIDVTSPAPFTELAMPASGAPPVGPIILWSRGNPDTNNGTTTGVKNNTFSAGAATFDYNAYLKMGETWSVPAFAYVGRDMARADDPSKKATATLRKPKGTDFVLYMGSGYGDPGQGTTFYSLDPLTGDVITSVDVDQVVDSSYPELKRTGMAYANAIVANPVAFNPARYVYAVGGVASPNVAAYPATRVYVADLYGRFWKFLTAAPDIAVPGADLGADQPVATAASTIGLPPNTLATTPYVFLTSGNDNRATGANPFRNFGFMDEGNNTTTAVSAPVTQNGLAVYPPMKSDFVIDFEPGFRGTVQPATVYNVTSVTAPTVLGRVFFAGTRFNAPNSTFAPPTPPYPCRSSFDSILYALGAETGLAAYGLAGGEDHVIFEDSRIAAISTQASPQGSQLAKDEGLSKPADPIAAPPAPGLAPTTQATQNIIQVSGPGLPQPTVRFGSTVCR